MSTHGRPAPTAEDPIRNGSSITAQAPAFDAGTRQLRARPTMQASILASRRAPAKRTCVVLPCESNRTRTITLPERLAAAGARASLDAKKSRPGPARNVRNVSGVTSARQDQRSASEPASWAPASRLPASARAWERPASSGPASGQPGRVRHRGIHRRPAAVLSRPIAVLDRLDRASRDEERDQDAGAEHVRLIAGRPLCVNRTGERETRSEDDSERVSGGTRVARAEHERELDDGAQAVVRSIELPLQDTIPDASSEFSVRDARDGRLHDASLRVHAERQAKWASQTGGGLTALLIAVEYCVTGCTQSPLHRGAGDDSSAGRLLARMANQRRAPIGGPRCHRSLSPLFDSIDAGGQLTLLLPDGDEPDRQRDQGEQNQRALVFHGRLRWRRGSTSQ